MAQYAPTKYNQDFKKPVVFGGLHHLGRYERFWLGELDATAVPYAVAVERGPCPGLTAGASSLSAVPSWGPVRTREALVTMMPEQAGNRVRAVYA